MALCHRLKFFQKKNPNFFPQHSEFDKCIRLCPTCMLEEWEKKMTLWILQTFLLFYFQSCCQIRLHWTRRTIQRTILDISTAHRITEDPKEEKMGLDSMQLYNTRDIKYFILIFFFFINVNATSYNYNNITFTWFYYQYYF